ncbi:hypothetical protein T484DRAFT_1900047 [Baffinella frigidus]|nr:hypothetical protein T484DRAFT_1900047 [Cryptophyta sp. CCMP2293]
MCKGSLLERAAQQLRAAEARLRAEGRLSLLRIAAAHTAVAKVEGAVVRVDARGEETARALKQDLEAGALVARRVRRGGREVKVDEARLRGLEKTEEGHKWLAAQLRSEALSADKASEEELQSLAVSDNTAEEVADDSKALAAQRQEEAAVKTSLAARGELKLVRATLRAAMRGNAAWEGEGARVQRADASAARAEQAEQAQAAALHAEEPRAQARLMAVLEGGAADGAGVARQLAALEVLGGRVRAVAAHCPRAHPVAAVAAPSGAAAAAKGEVIPRGGCARPSAC